jgi:Alpha/beta hydrolase domain
MGSQGMSHRFLALRVSLVCAIVLSMLLWAAGARASLPTITEIAPGSGQHGYPYDAVPATPAIPGAPSINLNAAGYVEREFKMSGGAAVYRQNGFWLPNGRWGASVAQAGVPYTTRLLVRYPKDAAKFNGTVVFEWLNDTTGGDQDPVWSELYNELLSQGFAYVGVTAQAAGMNDLKTWDPQRYGALGDQGDGQAYDIFTQAAQAIKADATTLLGGLTPRKLIGTGDSQSAFRIDTYVNAIQPLTHAFDGFMAVGRAVTTAPLGNGLISSSPFPALIRTDNTAPFIQVNTQGDIVELDAAAARQPDNNYLRTWELPGASHIDAHEASYEIETIAREQPTVAVPRCVFGTPIEGTGTALDGTNQVNNMPLFEVEDAAIVALQRWITSGTQPPHGQPISTTPLFFGLYDTVNTDQYGVGFGGIRLPEAQVPVEDYSPINFSQTSAGDLSPPALLSEIESALTALSTGSINNASVRAAGLCLLSGYFLDLSHTTLHALYPTLATYVSKYTAAANAAAAAGFLTPADAGAAIANAEAGHGPLQTPPSTIP